MKSISAELRLLLLCASVPRKDYNTIRQMVSDGVDWTCFVRIAVNHGLAGLVGETLARVVPDLAPADILAAFQTYRGRVRERNAALFGELLRILGALAGRGIAAIPLKGPTLVLRAYGDLGSREFQDLDFLVRDRDLASTISTLRELGYHRDGQLTAAQFELIHHLQGQEILFGQTVVTAIEPHTRLTPVKMAIDIDYTGLWTRASRTQLDGHAVLTLAPEDELLSLAVHGGKELWWNIKWACDVAAFIASHPNLDWAAVLGRGRAQGCFRMVLLAVALAREFHAAVPDTVIDALQTDPLIERMVNRVLVRWQAEEPVGPPSNRTISLDLLRLHDGRVRRARYLTRTLLLPGPHHVEMMPLPRSLSLGYIPVKLAHDVIALPLWRIYQQLQRAVRRAR